MATRGWSRRDLVRLLASTGISHRFVSHGPMIDVVHTRVFAATQHGGNPCPVVPAGDNLTDAQMLWLARRFGLDTAFLVTPKRRHADLAIRYFVPEHEMGVSGHATIAAVTVARQAIC